MGPLSDLAFGSGGQEGLAEGLQGWHSRQLRRGGSDLRELRQQRTHPLFREFSIFLFCFERPSMAQNVCSLGIYCAANARSWCRAAIKEQFDRLWMLIIARTHCDRVQNFVFGLFTSLPLPCMTREICRQCLMRSCNSRWRFGRTDGRQQAFHPMSDGRAEAVPAQGSFLVLQA